MARVLIIDDEKDLCEILADIILKLGHQADVAHSVRDGLEKSSQDAYDVVFLDVRLPDGNGLDIMPDIRKTASTPEVIIMTGFADPDGAEIAIKNGAWDYLQKPLSPKQILLPVKRVLQYRDELKKAVKTAPPLKLDGIIGSSPGMKKCYQLLTQAACSSANVLITGETGTGKELFAKAVHKNSPQSRKPFIVVDCAALPETIIESVLFGNVKGAFTGADKDRDGLIHAAHSGFLFLDEVGELPFNIQKAFLRVIQEHRFKPVGSSKEQASDFRLIAATNRNLNDMVQKGTFRQDLLFRLRSITIDIPPLREHTEDIKELASFYIGKICKTNHVPNRQMSPEFIETLCAYDWPGNVRELINTLESSISESREEQTLFAKHLSQELRVHVARKLVNRTKQSGPAADSQKKAPTATFPNFNDYKLSSLAEAEKKYFGKLMALTKGDIRQACKISGLGRTRLYALLKKHDISRNGWSIKESDGHAPQIKQ